MPTIHEIFERIRFWRSADRIGPDIPWNHWRLHFKSTLVDVLLGLLKPGKGAVLLDGVDIQTNLRNWQDQIGYVPQTIF